VVKTVRQNDRTAKYYVGAFVNTSRERKPNWSPLKSWKKSDYKEKKMSWHKTLTIFPKEKDCEVARR
jgi:hypothetical protein